MNNNFIDRKRQSPRTQKVYKRDNHPEGNHTLETTFSNFTLKVKKLNKISRPGSIAQCFWVIDLPWTFSDTGHLSDPIPGDVGISSEYYDST